MRIRQRAATLLIATALLGGVATTGTASASTQAKPVSPWSGSFWAGLKPAMPTTVKRGATVDLTLWYKQSSPDTLIVAQGLQLQDGSRSINSELPGVSVQWRDPATGRWYQRNHNQGDGGFFEQPGWPNEEKATPNTWGHLYLRITFGPSTGTGTWHLTVDQGIGFVAINNQGKYVFGGPEYYFPSSYTFKIA